MRSSRPAVALPALVAVFKGCEKLIQARPERSQPLRPARARHFPPIYPLELHPGNPKQAGVQVSGVIHLDVIVG